MENGELQAGFVVCALSFCDQLTLKIASNIIQTLPVETICALLPRRPEMEIVSKY